MDEEICPSCGHRNQPGANFCSSCGQPMERAADEPTTITFALDGQADVEISVDVTPPEGSGLLVVTRGPNAGSEYLLEHVITTLGRHPDSDVFLDDVTVSRRHAEVERSATSTVVRDVGSLNGTYLNQERIEGEATLAPGDEVQVGRFKLRYVAGEAS